MIYLILHDEDLDQREEPWHRWLRSWYEEPDPVTQAQIVILVAHGQGMRNERDGD